MPEGIDLVPVSACSQIRQWRCRRMMVVYFRLTGGEPLVRKGCQLARCVMGIEEVSPPTGHPSPTAPLRAASGGAQKRSVDTFAPIATADHATGSLTCRMIAAGADLPPADVVLIPG
jgi:hypothetical protein